ncbi:PRC-barrel domain protein [Roseovarius sp. THAF27]|uniref:PRC-barrel domain-containing protein n=1 Tax=unclassified Roseovarius TaxID=2614913 RepID=UPI0012A80538|nr:MULTISPECIES: PRC-barrel domain-containing protein [unclassified Roseovarius]QFT82526.1 PRC-barrel domain protein [Roseovarius sp. THAF27]QFT98443.1 PRC-barrel domain protein [Roseovarius sp. THAF8]
MKLIGSTAIAMALAATTAFAQSDSNEEMDTDTGNTQVESSTGMNSSDNSADASGNMQTEGDSDKTAMNDSGLDWDKSSEEMSQMQGELIRSRDITGGAVYTTNEANDEGESWDMAEYDEVNSEWNQIGEIEDLVMSKDGKLTGIIVEVGGFLDIGDKHVMLSVKDAKLVPVDDMSYTFVTRFNEEDIEAMNSVDEGFWN